MAVDSFFQDASRKRKRGPGGGGGGAAGKARAAGGRPASAARFAVNGKGKGKERARDDGRSSRRSRDADVDHDEELGGSGSEFDDSGSDAEANSALDEDYSSEEEAAKKESAAQKRLRLAKQYLAKVEAEKDIGGIDAAELERDIINERLQKDVLQVSGKLHLRIADTLAFPRAQSYKTSTKVHRLPLTCAVASDDCRSLFTSSKDGAVARYSLSSLLSAFTSSSPAGVEAAPSNVSGLSIVKTDFIPKRAGKNKGKGKAAAAQNRGKAGISRNQPSQDDETRGHTDEIYSLALSSDGKRLVTGGKDRRVGVWDTSPALAHTSSSASASEEGGCRWLQGIRGHKDSISAVSFRSGTSQVYTASFDRTVKVYDAVALSYVETLFGHQDKIYDIAVLRDELAVTAGGRDKTLRYWKIRDESQLVFRAGVTSKIRRVLEGGLEEDLDDEGQRKRKQANGDGDDERRFVEGSADCTAMVDDQHFISGGDSGTISLWSISKKKPIFTQALAHGLEEVHSATEGLLSTPRWIQSLATLPYSNLFASGSWDGNVRFWKIADDLRSFAPAGDVEAPGFVNSVQMVQLRPDKKKGGSDLAGVLVTAALGQEPKFGRWKNIKEAKNVALVAIIPETS